MSPFSILGNDASFTAYSAKRMVKNGGEVVDRCIYFQNWRVAVPRMASECQSSILVWRLQ